MSDDGRMNVTVYLFDADDLDNFGVEDGPPTGFEATMTWAQEKVAVIPSEHRDSTYLGISSLSYTRPETDAELADRLDRLCIRARKNEIHELAELARLKAKYPKTDAPKPTAAEIRKFLDVFTNLDGCDAIMRVVRGYAPIEPVPEVQAVMKWLKEMGNDRLED